MNTSPALPGSLARAVRQSVVATVVFAVLIGGVYPLAVRALARAFFPHQANGSLIARDGRPADPAHAVGSRLLGQPFNGARYFHPRPSAAGNGYDATSSGGTNYGPLSARLLDGAADDPSTTDRDESFAGVRQLVDAYRQENGLDSGVLVPADAVTRSASGLDPHISPRNAQLQRSRVARVRGLSEQTVERLIMQHTANRWLGIAGEPAVNVLELNLALDAALGPDTER